LSERHLFYCRVCLARVHIKERLEIDKTIYAA
jgi:hypothetical protein